MHRPTDGMKQFDRPDGSPIDAAVTTAQLLRMPLRLNGSGHAVIDEKDIVAKYLLDALDKGEETEEIVCGDGEE